MTRQSNLVSPSGPTPPPLLSGEVRAKEPAEKRICAALAAGVIPSIISAKAGRRLVRKTPTDAMMVMVRPKDALAPWAGLVSDTHVDRNPLPTGENGKVHGLIPETKLATLLEEYKDIFESVKCLPPDRGIGHTIPLVDGAQPAHQRMYRLSPAELDELKKQITDLLDKGLIQPSKSPWGAPILFAAKGSAEQGNLGLRLVVDYRRLNAQTVKNRASIPNPADLFDALAGATVFSSIDL